jgi:hypothetical protein
MPMVPDVLSHGERHGGNTARTGNLRLTAIRAFMKYAWYEAPPPPSRSVCDENSFFGPNAINRCDLAQRDTLIANPDGPVDLYLQAESPGPDREALAVVAAARALLAGCVTLPNDGGPGRSRTVHRGDHDGRSRMAPCMTRAIVTGNRKPRPMTMGEQGVMSAHTMNRTCPAAIPMSRASLTGHAPPSP